MFKLLNFLHNTFIKVSMGIDRIISKGNPFILALACQLLFLVGLYSWVQLSYVSLILGLVLLIVSLLVNGVLFRVVSFVSMHHVLYLNILRSGCFFVMYVVMGVLAQSIVSGIFLGSLHLGLELSYSKLQQVLRLQSSTALIVAPTYLYKTSWFLLLVGVGALWHLRDIAIFSQMWLAGSSLLLLYAVGDWVLTARDSLNTYNRNPSE